MTTPEHAVGRFQSWSPPSALKNGELMPQGENLDLQGRA
jgi:hypothetical protein